MKGGGLSSGSSRLSWRRREKAVTEMASPSPLFETFALADGVTLRNRVVMAPMTTWASNEDLSVSDE